MPTHPKVRKVHCIVPRQGSNISQQSRKDILRITVQSRALHMLYTLNINLEATTFDVESGEYLRLDSPRFSSGC